MEHEEKPSASHSSPSSGSGRTRVASAAATGSNGDASNGDAPTGDEDEVASAAVSGGDDDPPRDAAPPAKKKAKKKRSKGPGSHPNNVRKTRIERMMSKAELARRANLSVLTIDRVEKGYGCRMDTKRKILEALGLSLGDRVRVFGEEE